MKTLGASLLLSVLPLSAAAHPHIYVDTGFEVVVDDQSRIRQIRVTWAYDEYYSLLITEDMQLDQDFDGALTPEEQARLTGFDMKWIEGFNGDLVATLAGRELALSGPQDFTAELKDGRIITTHVRTVAGEPALSGNLLSMKPYDPEYYTAYEVTLPVTLSGGSACMVEAIPPDITGELAQMQQMLLRIDPNADLEENDIPLAGAQFATDVRVSCPAS